MTKVCAEQIVKAEAAAAKSTKAAAAAATKPEGTARAAERVTSRATRGATGGVEAGRTKRVILFLLFRIGEDFVGGLDVGKLILGFRVLVRVGMILLGQAVVGFFNIRRRCAFADTKGLVRVLYGGVISCGGMEGL